MSKFTTQTGIVLMIIDYTIIERTKGSDINSKIQLGLDTYIDVIV